MHDVLLNDREILLVYYYNIRTNLCFAQQDGARVGGAYAIPSVSELVNVFVWSCI